MNGDDLESLAEERSLGEIRRTSDPTKAILSESDLNKKYLCDYIINVATGCSHGCRFCYVPSSPNIRARPKMLKEEVNVENPQKEWGSYVLYRDHIPDELPGILDRKRKWKTTEGGCGVVGISFGTDCYMDARAGEITRKTVESLAAHNRHSRILTRNPVLAAHHIDTYKQAGKYVTIGSSINSLDAGKVGAIEVNAPGPEQRIRGLRTFADNDVSVYVSMSPTYPTMEESDMRELLKTLSELNPSVIYHEPINPRGGNFQMTVDAAWAAGEEELGAELAKLRDENNWVEYALTHFYWVQKIGADLGVPIHLWPDKQLVNSVEGEYQDWLHDWVTRQSPEEFAGRDTPDDPMPELPSQPY